MKGCGNDNTVLRTLYLTLEMDRELREIAFDQGLTIGDVTRSLIAEGLQIRRDRGQLTIAEKLSKQKAVTRPNS